MQMATIILKEIEKGCIFQVSVWLALTIEKGRVQNTPTDGQGQPQLPNVLKQLCHDGDPVTLKRDEKSLTHLLNYSDSDSH